MDSCCMGSAMADEQVLLAFTGQICGSCHVGSVPLSPRVYAALTFLLGVNIFLTSNVEQEMILRQSNSAGRALQAL